MHLMAGQFMPFHAKSVHGFTVSFRSQPHLFDVVELSDFRAENMNDNIAGINQHPITRRQTFNARGTVSTLFEVSKELIANC